MTARDESREFMERAKVSRSYCKTLIFGHTTVRSEADDKRLWHKRCGRTNAISLSINGNANLDRGLYRYRHLVENAFARLKQYWAVAFRYDKLKRNYESTVTMAERFYGYPCETSTDPSLAVKSDQV